MFKQLIAGGAALALLGQPVLVHAQVASKNTSTTKVGAPKVASTRPIKLSPPTQPNPGTTARGSTLASPFVVTRLSADDDTSGQDERILPPREIVGSPFELPSGGGGGGGGGGGNERDAERNTPPEPTMLEVKLSDYMKYLLRDVRCSALYSEATRNTVSESDDTAIETAAQDILNNNAPFADQLVTLTPRGYVITIALADGGSATVRANVSGTTNWGRKYQTVGAGIVSTTSGNGITRSACPYSGGLVKGNG